MVPFKVRFNPGGSIFDQVCFAAVKAILAGELKAGEAFPSVLCSPATLLPALCRPEHMAPRSVATRSVQLPS
jgi:hypothetical protein